MLTPSQHARVAKKCAIATTQAIGALPKLLADSEPEAAAAIVANLIKAYLACPVPEQDPTSALAEVIRIARREVAEAPEHEPFLPNS